MRQHNSRTPRGSVSKTEDPSARWKDHLLETYRGLLAFGVEGLKGLMLINGGAAITVLAYLGNIIPRAPITHPPKMVKSTLLWYGGGVLASTLALLAAYATRWILYDEELRRGRPVSTVSWYLLPNAIGVFLAITGAVCFLCGSITAARALTDLWIYARMGLRLGQDGL